MSSNINIFVVPSLPIMIQVDQAVMHTTRGHLPILLVVLGSVAQ